MILFLIQSFFMFADSTKWYNPIDEKENIVQNQGFGQEIGNYNRFPSRAKSVIPEPVYQASKFSTGISVVFYSNSPKITIDYELENKIEASSYMSRLAKSGIDLYASNQNGVWYKCTADIKYSETSCQTEFSSLKTDDKYTYRLYLPSYNIVKEVKIGVEDSAYFKFVSTFPENPIIVYGSSTVQGSAADRAALSYSSIIQRKLEYPLLNYGFDGNALLEPEVIKLILENKSRAFIIDCLENLLEKDSSTIKQLLMSTVKQIRSNSSSPVILVELTSATTKPDLLINETKANKACKTAYNELTSSGINNIFYLSKEDIGLNQDSFIDQFHLLDNGCFTKANALIKLLRVALDIPVGSTITTMPTTQTRDFDSYEWNKRHAEVINWTTTSQPKCVIIGDSITHFWGGNPPHPRHPGLQSWNRYLEPQKCINMGFGYDKIENALYRIYHDEILNVELEKIYVLLGTNNLPDDSDEEIVNGLKFFLTVLRRKQPKANIVVSTILPRKTYEDRLHILNPLIKEMVEKEGFNCIDGGKDMWLPSGKIDDSLFSDGTHPIDKGYEKMGPYFTV